MSTLPGVLVVGGGGIGTIAALNLCKGVIHHTHVEDLQFSAFNNPNISMSKQHDGAREFVDLYSRSHKTNCRFSQDTEQARWKKLLYNATFNPICAVLNPDTGALRRRGIVEGLVRPAMVDIVAVARTKGIVFEDFVIDDTIEMDEESGSSRPSMSVDVAKGNLIEVEVLLREVLREARSMGIQVNTLDCLYHLCKGMQQRTFEYR